MISKNPYKLTLTEQNEERFPSENIDSFHYKENTENLQMQNILVFYIEIVSNLLLYKTPAPSPIADLERLNMIGLKKEFNYLSNSYRKLLRKHHEVYLGNESINGTVTAAEVDPTAGDSSSKKEAHRNCNPFKHSESLLNTNKKSTMAMVIPQTKTMTTSEIGIQTDSEKPFRSETNPYLVLKRSETGLSSVVNSNINSINLSWTPFINPKRQDKFKHCPLELICEMARPSMSYMHELKDIFGGFVDWLRPHLESSTGLHFSRICMGWLIFLFHIFLRTTFCICMNLFQFLFIPSGPKIPQEVMSNYFSIGFDAEIANEFHLARQANPHQFTSRFYNKYVYGKISARKFLTCGLTNLHSLLRVKIYNEQVGQMEDLTLPDPIYSIVLLNINSYSGGQKIYKKGVSKTGKNFKKVDLNDEKLTVIGLNVPKIMKIGMKLGYGKRLAQSSRVEIEFDDGLVVQKDGEPMELENGYKISIGLLKDRHGQIMSQNMCAIGRKSFCCACCC